MRVEFDGSRVDCVELVQTKEMNEVEDHKITVVGPEVDSFEPGSKHSLAYVVEVAGKKMQPDFEPVIERKFHNYINCIEGVYYTGQRDVYYSCILCQTFSPSHVCVVTPERLGLCEAVSWLDAKAANDIPRVLWSMLLCTPSCRIL